MKCHIIFTYWVNKSGFYRKGGTNYNVILINNDIKRKDYATS